MATILLVEDEEPIRQLLGEFLREEGYRVMSAYHGAEALSLVDAERPDLVLTDLMMPVMNGAELCRRLKRNGAGCVPVIMMSAVGADQARQCGADAFIGKPFELDALLDLVARYVGSPAGPAAASGA